MRQLLENAPDGLLVQCRILLDDLGNRHPGGEAFEKELEGDSRTGHSWLPAEMLRVGNDPRHVHHPQTPLIFAHHNRSLTSRPAPAGSHEALGAAAHELSERVMKRAAYVFCVADDRRQESLDVFGHSWPILEKWIGRTGVLAFAVVAALAFVIYKRRRRTDT